jgi:DNA (cytosine-5)-methyltransferase 1
MPENKIKILELFAGGGGFSLGFDLVKNKKGEKVYEIILAVDNDNYACQTLKKYFLKEYGKENIVFEADITKPETHKTIIQKCRRGIDIIIGGPPCQSFSLIGPRSGNGKKNKKKYKIMDSLYQEYLKLVGELKPSFIIFENVKGILSKRKEGIRYIDLITTDFKRLGYSFDSVSDNINTDYIVLNAADYGVPQERERVFLIGNNIGIQNPYHSVTHDKSSRISLFEAIGDLPRLKAKITYTGIRRRKERENIKRRNKRLYNGEDIMPYHKKLFKIHYDSLSKKGKKFLNFIKPNGQAVLTHHVARGQKEDDILLFKSMKQGMIAKDIFETKSKRIRQLRRLIKYDMESFKDKYKKQKWVKPCSTIFAHLEKDGNRFIHPDSRQARTITPREAARIQSFPDYFEFEGPFTKKYRQIGNAVPPLLSMAIAKSLKKIWRNNNARKRKNITTKI